MMKLVVKKNGNVLASQVRMATSIRDRMLGLMFSDEIPGGDALWIKPCNSIHTFFMKYPIDILFLDQNLNVVKKMEGLRPWRMTGIYFRSSSVVEMRGGALKGKVSVGEQVEVMDV